MKIRRATINDALGIARVLHVGSWRKTYAGNASQKFLDSLKVEDRFDFSFIWDDLR